MYHFHSRVRYSEIGEDGCLTLTGMINYLQDCSTFQSEDSGVGVKYMEGRGKAWMLSSWRIQIARYPELGEPVTIGTWHCGNKGIYGYRNFIMEDAAGKRLLEAESSWFLLDLKTGLPCRVTEEDVKAYGMPEAALDLGTAPRKVLLPEAYEDGRAIAVSHHHIDTNHHVNNAQYVEIAREAAAISRPIRELRVDYRKAAVLGDRIYPRISRGQEEVTVALLSDREEIFAAVWMRLAENHAQDGGKND
ncbi:MAG: thioesterase [Lachnospiraceae bacterium]|nr:thioesterase [Lachnospiraceae bacterium]